MVRFLGAYSLPTDSWPMPYQRTCSHPVTVGKVKWYSSRISNSLTKNLQFTSNLGHLSKFLSYPYCVLGQLNLLPSMCVTGMVRVWHHEPNCRLMQAMVATRGHPYKLCKPQCTNVRSPFFTQRVINVWNDLPQTSSIFLHWSASDDLYSTLTFQIT